MTCPRSKLPGRVVVPIPWGNQPDDPADDPLAELIALQLGRYVCLPGFKRRPPGPCLLGARAECLWGCRDPAANYCAWVWIEQRPEGAQPEELERALGFSGERVRFWVEKGKAAFHDAGMEVFCGAESGEEEGGWS